MKPIFNITKTGYIISILKDHLPANKSNYGLFLWLIDRWHVINNGQVITNDIYYRHVENGLLGYNFERYDLEFWASVVDGSLSETLKLKIFSETERGVILDILNRCQHLSLKEMRQLAFTSPEFQAARNNQKTNIDVSDMFSNLKPYLVRDPSYLTIGRQIYEQENLLDVLHSINSEN